MTMHMQIASQMNKSHSDTKLDHFFVTHFMTHGYQALT